MERELQSATNLAHIVWHFRKADVKKPDFATRLMKRAIEKSDQRAVTGCFLFALEHHGTEKVANADIFVRDALSFLNDRENASWVSEGWFFEKTTRFYEQLSPERTAQILRNLGFLQKIDHRAERVLARLAKCHLSAVWDYFGDRLARDTADDESVDYTERFEAVPFQFHGLEKELSKNPLLAISKGLSWFAKDRKHFQFRGGRLLSNVFPNCTPEFATALADLVKAGDTEADFVLAILQNYDGVASTHVVLKEIVSRFSDDAGKMSEVRASIDSVGVVRGEFGLAEAWRARKESLMGWLVDERPAVKAFAEKHIAELDLMIASEWRRAESQKEMWRRNYEKDETESDGDDFNKGK